jgi:Spy/CpxP family protein refolding chaperone
MKKTVILVMMITLVSVSVGSAQRHRQFDKDMPGNLHKGNPLLSVPWDHVIEIAENAGLDSDQLQAIENARNILRDSNKDILIDLKDLRVQLHDIMIQTDPAYLKNALNISEQMSELRASLHQNKIRAEFEIKDILTPEQQAQIRETVWEHKRERARHRHEKRGQKMGHDRPMEREGHQQSRRRN